MLEGRFIDTLSRIHGTKPYLSDAEIIPQAGGFELVSMDSFSEREDFLHGLTPRQIGRQMAIGACADLLACGAKPETLLQSWIYDDRHGLPFYEDVANGIQEILDFHGAKCIGGDVGSAEDWQWKYARCAAPDVKGVQPKRGADFFLPLPDFPADFIGIALYSTHLRARLAFNWARSL